MSSHPLLATLFIVLALSTDTAFAEPAPKPATPTPKPTSINPCDPAWQKAGYQPAPVSDWPGPRDLDHFEYRLYKGSALWIGNASTPRAVRDGAPRSATDHRAIVKVDIHRADGTSQCFDDPHAWYLAAIPIESTDARNAVQDYFRVEPVLPHVLGYCYPASQVVEGCGDAEQLPAGNDKQAVNDLERRERQRVVEMLRQLEAEIRKLQTELQRLEAQRAQVSEHRRGATSKTQRPADDDELSRLAKQLASLSARLRQLENQRDQLQNDLQRHGTEPGPTPVHGDAPSRQTKACSGSVFEPGTKPRRGKPTHEVVTYDPKCVCNSVDGTIDITSP